LELVLKVLGNLEISRSGFELEDVLNRLYPLPRQSFTN